MSVPCPEPDVVSSDLLIDENVSAICLATPDGRVQTCNAAFVRLFGFSSGAEARFAGLTRIYPNGQWPALITRLRHERVIRRADVLVAHSDGRPLSLIQTVVGQFAADDTLRGIVLIAMDDTPRRALETHLREVIRMETVGRLASAMAHDFSNLLMVINGLGESLLERMPDEDPMRQEFLQLLDAGHRAATLTTHLLAVSRKPSAHPTIFDLDEAVRAMSPLIERLVGPHVRFTVDLGLGIKSIRVDRDQLEQILLNLATNARDAMPRGGSFGIRTARDAQTVTLLVADTGSGMTDDVRDHIFEPFFTTKPRGKGTGLGLWQVQTILSEHQGHIDVLSELDQGTTFVIRLPLAATPVAAPVPTTAAAGPVAATGAGPGTGFGTGLGAAPGTKARTNGC